jgi:acyl CoA:acetate/3-ketoacid CoA transferase
MRKVVNDEGWIGAEGRAHDDRVIGAALAHQGWVTWLQPRLKRQGLTLAEAAKQDEHGGVEPFHRLVTNYLKKQKIAVPGTMMDPDRQREGQV